MSTSCLFYLNSFIVVFSILLVYEAYKLYFILGSLFIIYLLGSRYMANKIGDKIEPCGTPCLSLYGLDIVVFILMEKVLSWI